MTKGSNANDTSQADERRRLREKVDRALAEARYLLESIERNRIKLEVMRELSDR